MPLSAEIVGHQCGSDGVVEYEVVLSWRNYTLERRWRRFSAFRRLRLQIEDFSALHPFLPPSRLLLPFPRRLFLPSWVLMGVARQRSLQCCVKRLATSLEERHEAVKQWLDAVSGLCFRGAGRGGDAGAFTSRRATEDSEQQGESSDEDDFYITGGRTRTSAHQSSAANDLLTLRQLLMGFLAFGDFAPPKGPTVVSRSIVVKELAPASSTTTSLHLLQQGVARSSCGGVARVSRPSNKRVVGARCSETKEEDEVLKNTSEPSCERERDSDSPKKQFASRRSLSIKLDDLLSRVQDLADLSESQQGNFASASVEDVDVEHHDEQVVDKEEQEGDEAEILFTTTGSGESSPRERDIFKLDQEEVQADPFADVQLLNWQAVSVTLTLTLGQCIPPVEGVEARLFRKKGGPVVAEWVVRDIHRGCAGRGSLTTARTIPAKANPAWVCFFEKLPPSPQPSPTFGEQRALVKEVKLLPNLLTVVDEDDEGRSASEDGCASREDLLAEDYFGDDQEELEKDLRPRWEECDSGGGCDLQFKLKNIEETGQEEQELREPVFEDTRWCMRIVGVLTFLQGVGGVDTFEDEKHEFRVELSSTNCCGKSAITSVEFL
mmetsp:Transcript_8828/g.21487  ORF Transcript_8828/g.21487 Transcript_8828/m.21487 type:complete len:606 (+) Transcript_8828:497-2314(+)|eukprot:CAMPEP_0178982620 /NCGR_PEP_ID=MMETSP0795-20121207/598_1 /TAXON_ID=88552 /ORGANISM="Amoebophrya sp., Strain Ameob2" /LENGTH=605 /DNA_ID=CAMNT_0020673287 /DNA_START=471 /DNA_END=2288 /DNA_ORIENTATION=+